MSDRQWKSNDRWTVTIEREGRNQCEVTFTEYDGGEEAEKDAERGYATDVALAVALGQAIKAVSPGDEQPWRLAVVVNLLDWLAKFDGSPELGAIADKAKEVFDAL